MCQDQSQSSSANQRFTTFCVAVRQWLAAEPHLDPPLAAALELLDRRSAGHGVEWFECELTHVATNTGDMHSMLGAKALLSLWQGFGQAACASVRLA